MNEDKCEYIGRLIIVGAAFTLVGALSGLLGYDLYHDVKDRSPIVRKYKEFQKDKKVTAYHKMKREHDFLTHVENKPEILEEFQTILKDQEVKEYKQLCEMDENQMENSEPPYGMITGTAAGFLTGLSTLLYGIRRHEKKKSPD